MSAEHGLPSPAAGPPPTALPASAAGPAGREPLGVTVVVLAGGTSRRFGSDKLAAPLRGSTVLDTVLRSLPDASPVVLVGPERDLGARQVVWTREDPPGGGPLAGVAAGVALVATGAVAVVAGDMPYAGPALAALVDTLRTAPVEVGAVVAVDAHGVPNPLLAVYRTASLRQALPEVAANRPAKLLLAIPHLEVAVTGAAGHDVDTPADLASLEHRVAGQPGFGAPGRA